MVEFLFAVGSFGMLHPGFTDDVRGGGDGDRTRRRLFCGRLPLAAKPKRKIRPADGLIPIGLFCALTVTVSTWQVSSADEPGPTMTLTAPRVASADGMVAESSAGPPDSAESISISQSQARASVQWLATLALSKMPRTFDGDKNWGETKKLWAGVKVRRDGLKLRTKRRFREVEHGRWLRYEVTLPPLGAPDAAAVNIHQVAAEVDPGSGQQRWKIDASIVAPLAFTARIQRWNLGLRTYSMTVSGKMRIRMRSFASIGFLADYAEIPPALVIDPRIEHAQLALDSFEVKRVSHVGGEVAQQWGELMEEILVDRFVKKRNERLVEKLNRSIDRERDELRLSMADWFSNW